MFLNISKERLQKDFHFLKDYLPNYFKNPISEIKTAPLINIEIVAISLFGLNFIFGALRSLYSLSFLGFIANIVVTPILGCVALLLISLFTYYFLQFWLQKTFSLQHILSIYFFAYLPGALFFITSIYYPPLFILGLIICCSLLTIGLTENLKIEKRFILNAVIAGFILCLFFWIFDFFYHRGAEFRPKSLDQLEQEMNQND